MKRCDYCGKLYNHNGIHVTEKFGKVWQTFSSCNTCSSKITSGEVLEPMGIADKYNLNQPLDVDIQIISETAYGAVKTAQSIMDIIAGEPRPAFLDKLPCPHCDLTMEDFIRTGKFGCGYCYEHYSEELEPILLIHQNENVRHEGKVAKCWKKRQMLNPDEKRKLLLLKKAKAVELEQYEEAAKIAEEIKKLGDTSS